MLFPRFVAPESDRQQSELLARMKALLQLQTKQSANNPGWYDPRYLNVPAERMPNYENLSSPAVFAQHLARRARILETQIELGSRVVVLHSGADDWLIRPER